MKRIRFSAAMSLDGFISGPRGEIDWIRHDPEMDFAAFSEQFDTLLVGRRTFDIMAAAGRPTMPGLKTVVVSSTLDPAQYAHITVIGTDIREAVGALRQAPGKDIWLFGGSTLLTSLLDLDLVDSLELAVQPVLLGDGIPLVRACGGFRFMQLRHQRTTAAGVIQVTYDVLNAVHSGSATN